MECDNKNERRIQHKYNVYLYNNFCLLYIVYVVC